MEATMSHIRNISLSVLAPCLATLLPSPSISAEHLGNWVSHPRSAITIVVAENGGEIVGPEWKYNFPADANDIAFDVAPGNHLVLRRSGEAWVGEYTHPRVRPGNHLYEMHTVKFVRQKAPITESTTP